MNQKEHLAKLLEDIDNPNLKVFAVCEWLEDINWHSECARLAQTLTPAAQHFIDRLQHADYILRPTAYCYRFIAELHQSVGLNFEKVGELLRQQADGNSVMIPTEQGSELISAGHLYEFQKAKDVQNIMTKTWGWGMSPKDWNGQEIGAGLVNQLVAMLEVKEEAKIC